MNPVEIYFAYSAKVIMPTNLNRVHNIVATVLNQAHSNSPVNYVNQTKETLLKDKELLELIKGQNTNKTVPYISTHITDVELIKREDDYFNNPPAHTWTIYYEAKSDVYKCLAFLPENEFICYGADKVIRKIKLSDMVRAFVK